MLQESHTKKEMLYNWYIDSLAGVDENFDQELTEIEGSIPLDIQGTLFRNGPGRYSFNSVKYAHPFDGDGMISKFTINEGKIHYQNAYVKTKEFIEEKEEGKRLYRCIGTNLPGGVRKNFLKLQFKNTANTNIIYHGKTLLSLWEGGAPHKINPQNLQTTELHNFKGKLDNPLNFLEKKIYTSLPFSAHPKIDQNSGWLYNFGLYNGVKKYLFFYQIDPDGDIQYIQHIDLGDFYFIHDFTLTETGKAIFYLSPVNFKMTSIAVGKTSPLGSMKTSDKKSMRVLVYDIKKYNGSISKDDLVEFKLPSQFNFHHINGYQTDSEEIIVDSCSMEYFPDFSECDSVDKFILVDYPPTHIYRTSFNLKTKEFDQHKLSVDAIELPVVRKSEQGKKYDSFFSVASESKETFPYFNTIKKISHSGQLLASFTHPGGFVGEPSCIGDKYIISQCYNAVLKKSELLIFCQNNLKLLSRITLPHSQSIGLHGSWIDGDLK